MPISQPAAQLPRLSSEELSRYARHLTLPEAGVEGQQRLKAAKVLCAGVGGLGSPLALYLAAAGAGTIGLVDFDLVDDSNLQRQIIHTTGDIGRYKTDSAAEKLAALNPFITIRKHTARLTAANALEILRDYDLIADCTDNFAARYLINDACFLLGKLYVHGSVYRFEGQASVFCAQDGPCYRCLHPQPPAPGQAPDCTEAGVLGVLPGLIGTIQAIEIIKLILAPVSGAAAKPAAKPLIGRLLLADALTLTFREIKLNKNPQCPLCGSSPAIRQLDGNSSFYQPAKNCLQETNFMNGIPQMSAKELKQKLDNGENVLILDVREPHEYQSANIGGVLMPMNTIPARLHEIPRDREIVVQCKSGARSQAVAEFLVKNGFTRVSNLTGGILGWASEVDQSLNK
jgi:adenylyltransferase/sulfurtransferase